MSEYLQYGKYGKYSAFGRKNETERTGNLSSAQNKACLMAYMELQAEYPNIFFILGYWY